MIKDGQNGKVCTHCGEFRPYTKFSPDTARRDGRGSWCRPCINQRVRTRQSREGIVPEAFPQEREPRSDWEVKRRNEELFEEKRGKEKKTCAQPGCPSKLNRWSKKFCMLHKAQDEANTRANLLRKNTPKELLERYEEAV